MLEHCWHLASDFAEILRQDVAEGIVVVNEDDVWLWGAVFHST